MNKIIDILKWIAIAMIYIVLSALTYSIGTNEKIHNIYLQNTILIGGELLLLLIFYLIFRKQINNSFKELKGNKKRIIKYVIIIWIIGLTLMVASNTLLSKFIKDMAENEAANRELLDKYMIYAIPSMVIIGPFIEEILFRLSIKNIINNKILFIIISSLLFGFAHVIGTTGLQLLYVIPYAILGATFAYIYQKDNNIFASFTAHFIHNLACILIILFS